VIANKLNYFNNFVNTFLDKNITIPVGSRTDRILLRRIVAVVEGDEGLKTKLRISRKMNVVAVCFIAKIMGFHHHDDDERWDDGIFVVASRSFIFSAQRLFFIILYRAAWYLYFLWIS
jgi:hypothetical protein